MLLNSLYIIIGISIVLYGADRLTAGASALARRMNIPEIVIGLTIVAAGTSAPEFFVSLMSALNGTPDMAVGNVVGSNIFNVLLIVGVTAMVAPINVTRVTVNKDMVWAIVAAIMLLVLCIDRPAISLSGNSISRLDGIVLLAVFLYFMNYTLRMARKNKAKTATRHEDSQLQSRDNSMFDLMKNITFFICGLAMLIFGSNLFVSSASYVALTLGISESIVGLTIVAGGTSLPELATSVVAAKKGNSAIAIGNVIGSNVFNTLAILGSTAVICPMQINGINIIDILTMVVSMLVLWLFSKTKLTVERWEGGILTLSFATYMAYLLSNI